ncbi:hypothetical protein I4U23_003881 [Adineta vaga]|nr:hypothetical protein I4U23_003881 [Adineta vaga]
MTTDSATTTMTDYQYTMMHRTENKESITIIWFDPSIGSNNDTERTKTRLRQINDYVVYHTDLDVCITYIHSIDKENIFLITAGSCASEILARIFNLDQIDTIFIFCYRQAQYEHLLGQYSKIIGIYVKLDLLCTAIQEQVDIINKQTQSFIIYDRHQKSTKALSKQSAEFLWFQLFNDVILRLPRNQDAKKQMIDVCRSYYRNQQRDQLLINEFEEKYQSKNAILWYSKESFLYKMVNKALRTEDIDQLHIFRFFIGDLSESLVREHNKILESGEQKLTLYRGTQLSNNELDILKENEGKFISTNGFLSTSRLRTRALNFAKPSSGKAHTNSVLFEIICDIQELGDKVIFADISEFSAFPNEQEVLFDLCVTSDLTVFNKKISYGSSK